jgi:hypothetical protein
MQTKEYKKKNANTERISLTPEAAARIDTWIGELQSSFRGIKLRRKSLVEWLIQSHSPELSNAEKKIIKNLFFDEVSHAQWLVRELRAAKGRGELTKISDLLGSPRKLQPNATAEENGGSDV